MSVLAGDGCGETHECQAVGERTVSLRRVTVLTEKSDWTVIRIRLPLTYTVEA